MFAITWCKRSLKLQKMCICSQIVCSFLQNHRWQLRQNSTAGSGIRIVVAVVMGSGLV